MKYVSYFIVALFLLSCTTSKSLSKRGSIDPTSESSISGRKLIYRDPDMVNLIKEESGTITFNICIDEKGIVEVADLIVDKTTITNEKILQEAIETMKNYRFEADVEAEELECGKYAFTIDNYSGIKKRDERNY